jgi:hypothetical protein
VVKTLTDADLNALLVASVRHAAKMPGQPSVFPKFQTGTYDDMAGFARAFGVSLEQLRREFDAVKVRYEGTEGWMKAPNGQPTNLNRDQWVLRPSLIEPYRAQTSQGFSGSLKDSSLRYRETIQG